MDSKQQFKAAFIEHCINNGYTTPEQVHEQVKQALAMTKDAGMGDIAKALGNFAGRVGTTGMWIGALAPPIAGSLLGHNLGKLTHSPAPDIDEIKKQELIDEYKRNAQRLRAAATAQRSKRDRESGPGRRYF